MADVELVIRGGTVVDGTGAAPFHGDVAVDGGRIVEVGTTTLSAARTIDAHGLMVAPGWVDIHTHYDGQATWDERLTPSSWHGVTTAVAGNCGVGFAPVHARDHQALIELMEGVEDIPGTALHEGLSWAWSSFAEFLDAVDARPHDIEIAMQVPHGALRLYVMGERGADGSPATAAEISAMGIIAREAIAAGALGFTTSRTKNHRTSTGAYTPTLRADARELIGIAQAIGEGDRGVLQVVSDFESPSDEIEMLRAMMQVSGRPLSISLAQNHRNGESWRGLVSMITAMNAEGLCMRAQVAVRPIGVLLGLQATVNPLIASATYRNIAAANSDVEDLAAALREPANRAAVIAELGDGSPTMRTEQMFVLGALANYEPASEDSLAAIACRRGVSAMSLLFDELVRDDGRALVYAPVLNYANGDLNHVHEMLQDPYCVPGLSDGGAHVGTICDASFPTTLLQHWGRDRAAGTLPVELLIAQQCRNTAVAVGLFDRGVLALGLRADINVIDFENLAVEAPTMAFDLPAGGKRLLQRARGYRHTFVHGVETYADGEATGALPGRLVRGTKKGAQ